jgi:hypothetical protein
VHAHPFVGCANFRRQGAKSSKERSGTRPLKAVESETASPTSKDKESSVTDRRYNGSRHDRKESERINPDQSGTNRFEGVESERFRSFTYKEQTKHDKVNLDITRGKIWN